MNENAVEKCSCDIGIENGAISKFFEFDNFTIFGNLSKNSSIVIRYNGTLCNKKKDGITHPILIYYVFDNDWTNKNDVFMTKCYHHADTFCVNIDLEQHNSITFGFYNSIGEFDKNYAESYNLKISEDKIDDIMKRYNLEDSTNLPIAPKQTEILSMSAFFASIKNWFKTIIRAH